MPGRTPPRPPTGRNGRRPRTRPSATRPRRRTGAGRGGPGRVSRRRGRSPSSWRCGPARPPGRRPRG